MKNINRKIFYCIITALILHPIALNAKNIIATNFAKPIDSNYLLEIIISENVSENNCEKLLKKSCFFRDSFFSEPYFHQTKIIIFDNKVFASQLSNDKTNSLEVKDGAYSLALNSNNMISFNTQNGNINDLKLTKSTKDDLPKELVAPSHCQKAEFIYNFYKTYNRNNEILTKIGTYKDEYNFQGLNDYILFAEAKNQAEIMALNKDADDNIAAIKNIRLCKMPSNDILKLRHLSAEECNNNTADECTKYDICQDKIAVENCEVVLFGDGFN